GTMVLFIVLVGVFAVGAPGVPGGTVIASLGIVTSILGFDEGATALLLTVFALQDSFGTACNITGDAALCMVISKHC
ncbi:MAG: cation:dicarboxylase symporter family transporter, partial [Rikenellaceae bacterium]